MVKLGIERRCLDVGGNQLHRGDRVLILSSKREAMISDQDQNFGVVWLNDERWSYDACSLQRLSKPFTAHN